MLFIYLFIIYNIFFTTKSLQAAARIKDRPLSELSHMSIDGHNKQFDHEAFLGDDVKTFDQLSPTESKKRLADLVDLIDTNDDNLVTHDELKLWIHKAQKNHIIEDIDRQWKTYNPQNKTLIKWTDYKKTTYGFMDELDPSTTANEDTKTYREMMRRDKRRWDTADGDKDGSLNKDEFMDFLHPEESSHMHSVVIEETLEDIDKDKDGKVSFDEYISDIYSPESKETSEIPDWVVREREQFKNFRDKNGDGYLDKNEIRDWIIPPDYDHSDAEATHLILESDGNKDGKLTKDEILQNYDLFVGSQATDFGEALMSKDEL